MLEAADMRERMARAIWLTTVVRGTHEQWDALDNKEQWPFLVQTDAVLDALMEPTIAMLNAASKAMSPGKRPTQDRVSCKRKHRIRYQAIIGAIK